MRPSVTKIMAIFLSWYKSLLHLYVSIATTFNAYKIPAKEKCIDIPEVEGRRGCSNRYIISFCLLSFKIRLQYILSRFCYDSFFQDLDGFDFGYLSSIIFR